MDISLMEVLGPVLIGPSSSHTAGAARLARAAAQIAGPFVRVEFGLHGSLAETGLGHGTHKALLAGAMGLREDDEALRDAYTLAQKRGVEYSFEEIDLPDAHENTARITFIRADGSRCQVQGSSIGGGRIRITGIDGMPVEITGEAPTLLVLQRDVKGVVSAISRVLAEYDLNIGIMRVARTAKGRTAATVVETDSPIPPQAARELETLPDILSAQVIFLQG